MHLPVEMMWHRSRISAFPAGFGWRFATERTVNETLVVIGSELRQLSFEVAGVPEEDVVEVFPADGAN